jgi:transposase-like protein
VRLRAEIDELFSSDRDLASILEDVARVSVRLMMQTALEAEVDAFLGRERYQRRDERSQPGSRNGWQPPARVHTMMGSVELQRPKLRGTDQAFCSRLFGAGVTRTNALESLVISGWVRGLSDRDIEAALAEVLGPEAALSKSTVSRICSAIREEFAAWRARDLSEVRLDYLFLDASHFKMHPGAPAEPVLAAWGIDTNGKPVFVGLAPASSESTDADLTTHRGLRAPLLPISDGAPGLTGAFDRAFPTSLRQRCLVHRARNTLAKVSVHDQAEVKADLLGGLRRRRGRTRRCGGRRRPAPGRRIRRQVAGPLPRSGRLRHRRPGLAHGAPAVPG